MNRIKHYFDSIMEDLLLSTSNRLCVQLQLFCVATLVISLIMTLLNVMRGETALGIETAAGAIISISIYCYTAKTKRHFPGALCMAFTFLILVSIFLISGAVEGFAALWYCLYPFVCLFVLNLKWATSFSMLGFVLLAVILWTPLSGLLPPVYTQNFLLRFPLLYFGNFAFAFALNGFYYFTYNRLLTLNQKFERLSNQDGLTKLANRTYLETYVKSLLTCDESHLFCLMLDVDFFKQYNDTYGHLAGDDVLKAIGTQIGALLPGTEGLAVRYGGEEFLVLLPRVTREEALAVAETLRTAVLKLKIPHKNSEHAFVSVSIGVSGQSVCDEATFMQLLGRTDDALYCAKQAGRNCVITRDPTNQLKVLAKY